MVHQKAAKPATAPHGEPASVIEQLGGQLDTTHTTTPIVSQADNALTPSLTDLASRIRAEHDATAASLKRGAEHAMAAGQLLIAAKKQLKHGAWLPWLRDHCVMPERTARLYMRLAGNRELIETQIGNVADFSVRGAIALISAPATEKYAGVVSEEWAEDRLDIAAFEQTQAHSKKRHEAFSDVDLIIKKLIEFGETTADVDCLGDQLICAINECRDLLRNSVAVHVPFNPCSDATAAILRAKDLAVEILRCVEGAA
jgi:hypothetical protein